MVDSNSSLTLTPIGVVRTPFKSRDEAPRQPAAARDVEGRVELNAGPELADALQDLEGWSHLWLIFWFHENQGWRPRVTPPRSDRKRGLFATRSPHRPNPLGLSLVRLKSVEGSVLHVLDVDLLDGTPLLDIKPYVAYADQAADAAQGWLEQPSDPLPPHEVFWSELALAQLHWLEQRGCDWLRKSAERSLALGPEPHAYRRIKPDGDAMRLAVKDFRLRFVAQGRQIHVQRISSGYEKAYLDRPDSSPKSSTPLAIHRDFLKSFHQ